MFKIIGKVQEGQIEYLMDIFRRLWAKDIFSPDVSSYARGRMKFWIQIEAPLFGNKFLPGYNDIALYNSLKNILPDADLFLVHTGSGISPHRDASSLSSIAYGIQLSGTATFQYASRRDGPIDQEFLLNPGDIFSFNSKHLHGSVGVSSNRLAINAWKIKPEHKELILPFLINWDGKA